MRSSRRSRFALGAPVFVLLLVPAMAFAQAANGTRPARPTVRVANDSSGTRLQVDGRDFFVRGVNWDYIPIGQNYAFDLFAQPEEVIVSALEREMGLIAAMGANTIRVNAGIPPRWVAYIHERYGIWCIVNHPVGRYGFTLDGVWRPSVDYSDPRLRAALAEDVAKAFAPYRDVPGVLLYLLGNENNYGLSWKSFEIEALPKGERDAARARHLYSLFDEIAEATHASDPGVPVAIANGDVQYVDVIAAECPHVDVFGTNVYRGISARDLFQVVREKLARPVLFTEFGCDAFNAREMHEDQGMQARYLIGQWHEIHEQSAGHGRENNAIGGCVFQWSDGWWKFGQTRNLDVHDTNASWPNGGYAEDQVGGENNMNEEWWGICAKGPADARGLFELYPRAAFYALRQVFAIDPYAPGMTVDALRLRYATITPAAAVLEARGSSASRGADLSQLVRVAGLRLDFETISTGSDLTRPPQAGDPAFEGFDQFQTYFADFEATPSPQVVGRLSLNFRGNVPTNPIDQIFYENRSPDRVKVYQAGMHWDDRWYAVDAFYRTGHYHWGYEGDFFGLYREANYGSNVDVYDAAAPVGMEIAGKRSLDGLKIGFGPELWWGAPPALLAKYRHRLGRFDAATVFEQDLNSPDSLALVGTTPVALKPTTKLTLYAKTTEGSLILEAGGMWANHNQVGEPFQTTAHGLPDDPILLDRIRTEDTFGGKLRVTGTHGALQWYTEASRMGLVAEGGPTGTTTITGWALRNSGLGNLNHLSGGAAYNVGRFQVAPNVLWQKPIVGPMPAGVQSPGRLRNILDDPFAVRGNREMTAAELLLSYDPTPGTWLYEWDNEVREDARLAGSIGYVFRHYPTGMDAAIGVTADGTTFVFDASTPPRDLWEVNGRLVSRVSSRLRVIAHAYLGRGEPNLAPDPRIVKRWGGDVRLVGNGGTFYAQARFNDWGPYDFYRDYNLTYPVQLFGEVARTLGTPDWLDRRIDTRIGVRGIWRTLDVYSLRYAGLPGDPDGHEWELRTFLQLGI